MLTLLKPWQSLQDIDPGDQSLSDTFLQFESSTMLNNQNIIKNIDYFHQCCDSASKHNEHGDEPQQIISEEDVLETEDQSVGVTSAVYTQNDLEATLEPKVTRDELLYTNIGMLIAEESGCFKATSDNQRVK